MAWFRVVGQTFVCAVQVVDAVVVDTCPVLKWILFRRDRSMGWLYDYAARQDWTIDRIIIDGRE
jgi:hypothetical protein